MKKYILMLAVAAATALVACGNKEAATEETAEPAVEEVAVVEEVATVDSTATDSAAVEAPVEAPAAE